MHFILIWFFFFFLKRRSCRRVKQETSFKMHPCTSSTTVWPLCSHLFWASSLRWHESHCEADLIWLLGIFCQCRDYRNFPSLTGSVQSSVHSQAGPKKQASGCEAGRPGCPHKGRPTMSWGCCSPSSTPAPRGCRCNKGFIPSLQSHLEKTKIRTDDHVCTGCTCSKWVTNVQFGTGWRRDATSDCLLSPALLYLSFYFNRYLSLGFNL